MIRSFLAALLFCPSLLSAQTISFTFDDGLDPRIQPLAAAWNNQILAALADANVKAMLFPAGKVVGSPEGMKLVESWSQRGHAIGNHTLSHRSLGSDQVSIEFFTSDVLAAEAMFKHMNGWSPRLRFPYLKEGNTPAKRDGMRRWMSAQGYLPAPVSIDTSDWYYNQRFLIWRTAHPNADAAPLRTAYLAHLWDRANYYDDLCRRLLGRSPAHVMLLHTNFINATFLPDVLAMFRDRGWKIVSPQAALADALYSEVTTAMPAGESIVWALAKQANVPGLRYPAEDDVYEEPTLRALGF